jgi:hypothetical protein
MAELFAVGPVLWKFRPWRRHVQKVPIKAAGEIEAAAKIEGTRKVGGRLLERPEPAKPNPTGYCIWRRSGSGGFDGLTHDPCPRAIR